MLENINTSDNQAASSALLDDPAFREGFATGMEAYLEELAEDGHPMTTRKVCREVSRELDPRLRQNNQDLCAFYGWKPASPAYEKGFLAGWVAAHMSEVHTIEALHHA